MEQGGIRGWDDTCIKAPRIALRCIRATNCSLPLTSKTNPAPVTRKVSSWSPLFFLILTLSSTAIGRIVHLDKRIDFCRSLI